MLTYSTIKAYMKYQSGLTLIELVITLAVIAIVIAVGTPGLQRYSEMNRAAAQNNLVTGTLTMARSEAIKRGVNVVMCGSDDGVTCNTTQWEKGWIVFVDMGGDGAYTPANDTLLAVVPAFTGGLTMRAYDAINLVDVTSLNFQPNGGIASSGAAISASLKTCTVDADPKKARVININPAGLLSIAKDTDGTPDYIVNDVAGNNVACP